MFRFLLFIILLISQGLFSQIDVSLEGKIPLKVKQLISIGSFEDITFIDFQNAYKKVSSKNSLSYSNIQLGPIASANAFNNLKINLFYQDLNTIIILDNRLAEIFKINLNDLKPYKNISHISTGYDNTLWLFNADLQQLELFDYKANKVRLETLPVDSLVLDLKSDYNYVWLLTESYLFKYNYQGSLISRLPNNGYTAIAINDENVLIGNDKALFYLDKESELPKSLDLPDLLIKQFLLAGETLYIYDGKILYQFQIKIN